MAAIAAIAMRASMLVCAAAVVVAACGGGSTDDDTATNGPSTTRTSTTTTTTRPETSTSTTTLAATSTSEASTTTTEAPTTDAAIIVIGDAEFTQQIESGLELLEEEAPEWYAEVRENIVTIQSVTQGSGMDVFTKTYLVGDDTAFAPGYAPDEQVEWLAGTIVHDACHSDEYSDGRAFIGQEAELECLQEQLDSLTLLDNDRFEEYVRGLIESADDPESQYWTNPDRHW